MKRKKLCSLLHALAAARNTQQHSRRCSVRGESEPQRVTVTTHRDSEAQRSGNANTPGRRTDKQATSKQASKQACKQASERVINRANKSVWMAYECRRRR